MEKDVNPLKPEGTQHDTKLNVKKLSFANAVEEDQPPLQSPSDKEDAETLKTYLCNLIDLRPTLAVGFKRKFDRLIKAKKEYHDAYDDFAKSHEEIFNQHIEEYSDDPVFYERMLSSTKKQKQ